MRRGLTLLLAALLLSAAGYGATKESGSTTLKNVEPVSTTDKQHKKQQYDMSFASSKNDYTCRTGYKEKVKATDFVVGSTIDYKVNGNKGNIKDTQSGKSVKCTVVRVAAPSAPAPTQQ